MDNTPLPLPTTPGHIVRTWTERYGFLWLKEKAITVEARQILFQNEWTSYLEMTAIVTIYVDGQQMFVIDIPHALPSGDEMLGLQVYSYLQNPENKKCIWKKTIQTFCKKCKGFTSKGDPQWVLVFWAGQDVTIRRINNE